MSRAGLLLAGIVIVTASNARAEVYEISDNGTVSVRGPTGSVAWHRQDEGVAADFEADGAAGTVPSGALTIVGAPDAPARFKAALYAAAERYKVSPSLLASLVWHESRWQPAAVSSKGAIGLAQLMPATARALAVDPRDAAASLDGAAHYLRMMLDRFDGDIERALAAYNAGPGRVIRANGVPAIRETRTYVSAIIERLESHGGTTTFGEQR